jgi:hypothetical protein
MQKLSLEIMTPSKITRESETPWSLTEVAAAVVDLAAINSVCKRLCTYFGTYYIST